MKAACWQGTRDIRIENVPEPRIINPRDILVRVTSTAICGSDLHLYNNKFPGMTKGDIMGHECMGVVVEVGSGIKNLKEGDRVVVPCTIACGACFYCKQGQYSACDNSNPNPVESEKILGYPGCGMFGYAAITGSYAGGQAEYIRVPFGDVGPIKVPEGVPDEQVLFLSDILPTGWMGAANCGVQPGDIVAVWGAGPVGQMAIRSLLVQGAERVIVIDNVQERLDIAARCGAEAFNSDNGDVYEHLLDETGGRGPDACLDAVGMEAHGHGVMDVVDRVKQVVKIETDRPAVLREMFKCVRKAGTISLLGVYGGLVDSLPMGVAFNKGVTFRMGQVRVQALEHMLLDLILKGKIHPDEIITHTIGLDDVADAYNMFNDKTDGCLKVVMKPGMGREPEVRVRSAAKEVVTSRP
ncbi:MAG TPA: zinc-dependent alcohol dehydrogenase [Phycisphaerales bacterium]|nr:zinc-dependent alcohol dehydrogenase [Phycisphaerales bacterium]